MCLKTAMASPLSRKPLNPHAKSWFPDAQKPSEDFSQVQKLPFSLPYQSYGPTTPPVSAANYEPHPQPTYQQLHQPVAVFQTPHQGSYLCAAVQHECLPFRCLSGYPIYPYFEFYSQPASGVGGFLMEKRDDEVKGETIEKLVEDSESLKEILGISSRPKDIRKFVPPRLRRGYFKEFRGRKRLPRKVWKPKNSDDGVAATEIVPPASPPKEEFPFCKNTTVMLKNIPNQYRRDSLMEFLNKKCLDHQLAYDFLYLPMDFMRGDNLGFAFVNFTTASAAMKIKSALEGYEWGEFHIPQGKFTSKKILEITWAKIQGKDALVRHFENSRFTCNSIQYLPVVISPPSNGSSTSISSLITIGKLQGFSKSSRPLKNVIKPSA